MVNVESLTIKITLQTAEGNHRTFGGDQKQENFFKHFTAQIVWLN